MTPKSEDIDVRYVADLARIRLSDEEAEAFQREIGEIVGYVHLLGEADVEGIEPTAHAMPVVNVLREDVPRPSLNREAVLANAPAVVSDTNIQVPAILPTDEEGA
jgi:aspartyl-tRNA(Asn)/glutamyl-tRNA(Gln) amidotransferase subunit C